MPNIDSHAHNQLLLNQFLAVGKQLKASDDAKSLHKALEHARLLMTIEMEQIQTAAVVESSEVQQLRKQLSELTEQVAVLTT